MTTIPLPILLLLLYALLDKEPISKEMASVNNDQNPPEEDKLLDSRQTISFSDRLHDAKHILSYILFLFITYLSEYLSNHTIITTLAFPNAPFNPRDHNPYYLLAYHIGKFVGRSHLFLVSTACPKLVLYIRIKRTWVLALIAFLHGVFFFLASWFRFVSCVEIIIALCATEGFTAGSMYLNSAHTVSDLITHPEKREFALCLLTVGKRLWKAYSGVNRFISRTVSYETLH